MAKTFDKRRHNFFIIDNAVLDNYELSPHALVVYAWLARFSDPSGRSFPSIPTVALRSRMSQPSVRKALRELVAAELVEIVPYAWKSNDYRLLPVQDSTTLSPQPQNDTEDSTSLRGGLNVVEGGLNVVESNKTQGTIPKEQEWIDLKESLRLQMGIEPWEMYIHPTKATFDQRTQCITVHSPNRYVYDWLTMRLHRVIRRNVEQFWPGWDLDFAEPIGE